MDSLTIIEGHDAQHSTTELRYDTPESYPTVGLDFARQWRGEHAGTPLTPNVGALSEHLLVEIPRSLHERRGALPSWDWSGHVPQLRPITSTTRSRMVPS